jgi:UDP-N-acetylglucosamine 4,6-dehydratase
MIETSNLFVTGGCGTFGQALARRRKKEGWTGKLTVYSTDTMKHEKMRRTYPDINFIQGDIRNSETLYNGMVGHDIVIHAAAVKVIPASEYCTIDTIDVNINGTLVVCATAVQANIKHVLNISTDKAAHAANAYGATKYLTEKILQEYARQGFETQFHLVRFGNVLESNGSVIEAWKKRVEAGLPILITDPGMTRYWLSPDQAVSCAIEALELETGHIFIPVLPSLSIDKLAEYTVGDVEREEIPVRPGEKHDETLLTIEETFYVTSHAYHYDLAPITDDRGLSKIDPYTSYDCDELTREELTELLND